MTRCLSIPPGITPQQINPARWPILTSKGSPEGTRTASGSLSRRYGKAVAGPHVVLVMSTDALKMSKPS